MRINARDIRPIAGALGAEILGIDLAHDLEDETVAAIRAAWLEHLVIFFRDQELRPRAIAHARHAKQEYTSEHPVVRTHPETGRKALYVNGGHTLRFKDMSVEESAPLLNYLFQHMVRPEFTCRFRWEPRSIALWDNR